MSANLLISFLLLVLSHSTTAAFSVQLIHRAALFPNDSTPLLNRLSAHTRVALARSHRRIPPSVIDAPITPHYADHFMRFSVGTPPASVLAVMDTGSDLTWLRCTPCADCFGRDVHAFHPTSSSTYETLPCDSEPCKLLDPDACGRSRNCSYQYGYGDGSFTTGVVSTETLTFDSTDGKQVSIPHVAFGCGYNNSRSFDAEMFGLAGLGGQSISLVSQLGPLAGGRFSYCLSPFWDNTSTSFMNFGCDAVVHGENVVTTALVEGGDKTFYFVTLQGVSVGNERINANAGRGGNMFIDSGTTVSLVEDRVWKRMGDLISEAVGLPHRLDPGGTFMCYEAGGSRERFPDITFHFVGRADVVLKPTNAFTEPTAEGTVCLAMQATNGTGIMGNLAQHNFHIGYDLVGRKVAFQPTDCSSHRVLS